MNSTRNGKIARLPRAVRQELNRRLHEGEQGKKLVVWLNTLPEVQAMVATEWEGKPIREQNLSEWKQGGYRDWLAQQEALEVAARLGEDAMEWNAEGRPPLTDTLALWVAARYAVATRRVADADGAEGWRLLRELCGDLVELRRGDHSAERIRMERERLEFDRARDREKTEEELWAWAMQDENRERICQGFKTPAEKMALLRQLMFGDPPGSGRNAEGKTAGDPGPEACSIPSVPAASGSRQRDQPQAPS